MWGQDNDLGAYTRKTEDGRGGTIYIWEQHTKASTSTNVNPFYGNDYIPGLGDNLFYETHNSAHSEEMQVFCNSNGIIYKLDVKFK